MLPDTTLDQEEDYASSEDSDFAPEDAAEREESAPSDDDDDDDNTTTAPNDPVAPSTASGKRKRKQAGDNEAEDAGFENSGDEAIIGKGKKRLKRAMRQNGNDDDEGGEGGLIKTRAQRAAEKIEKKYEGPKGPVTIDVEALWQQMLNDDKPAAAVAGPTVQNGDKPGEAAQGSPSKAPAAVTAPAGDGETMIRIKRTYNFAGKVHTEEKLVPRDSAEGKLYLASLDDPAAAGDAAEPDQPPKRMPRKAFRSIFEPVTDPLALKRDDLKLGLGTLMQARETATRAEAKKLNTVEKSRMDWAGYVDKEGIKDELALAGKSKTSFVSRQDFLARSEARREEEARRARLAGKV